MILNTTIINKNTTHNANEAIDKIEYIPILMKQALFSSVEQLIAVEITDLKSKSLDMKHIWHISLYLLQL